MKKFGYIYETMNKKNMKVYIGQSVGQFKPDYLGSGLHIRRAIQKNGVECFEVKILAYAGSKKRLDALERKYIAEYRKKFPKQIYNIHDGGTGWDCGKNNPINNPKSREGMIRKLREAMKNPETRSKISQSAKKRVGKLNSMYGRKQSEETKRKISLANTGTKHSKEFRLAVSLRFKGKPSHRRCQKLPLETRLKMSQAHKGLTHTEAEKQKIRQARLKYFSSPENREKQSLAMMGNTNRGKSI
jgi:group I intron endonuclease